MSEMNNSAIQDLIVAQTDSSYPDLDNVPQRERVILALKAFGVNTDTIAQVVGLNPETVRVKIREYDPEGRYIMSTDARKRVIVHSLTGMALSLCASLESDELTKLPPKERIRVLEQLGGIISRFGEGVKTAPDNPETVASRLRSA